jgi:hypothetical protein
MPFHVRVIIPNGVCTRALLTGVCIVSQINLSIRLLIHTSRQSYTLDTSKRIVCGRRDFRIRL